MAELFQRIRTQITEFYQSLDRRMKIWLAAGGFFVVVVVAIIILLTRPTYVPLVTVEWEDMAAVVAKLDEKGISNKDDGSNTVLVPQSDLTTAKAAIAVDLNLDSPDYGWTDVFANTSFTMTSDVKAQQINQAMASQLGQGLQQINGVVDANVQLTIAPDSAFLMDDGNESSVSVMLVLENGFQFSQSQISGMVNFITNAVEDLKKENITIIDQTGQTLNRLSEDTDAFIASTNYEQTRIVKDQLEDDLTNFLSAIYGRTHVRVLSTVVLDFDDYSSQSTAFSPSVDGETTGMIRSMTELSESVNGGDTAEGVAGTASNTDTTDYPSGTSSASTIESASRTINYEMNEINEVLTKAKGTIKDVNISILIDTTILENNEFTDENRQELTSLITTAAGLETRSVSIMASKFTEDEMGLEVYDSSIADVGIGVPIWLLGVIVGVLLVGVIIFVLLSRRKSTKVKEEEIAAVQAAEAAKREEEIAEIQMDVEDKSSPKYQIEKFIDAKPESVAALLRSWMTEM